MAGAAVEIRLRPAAALVGRVVRADGAEVPGARIQGKLGDDSGIVVLEGLTDSSGSFSFEGLQAGLVFLDAIPEEEVALTRTGVRLVAGETTEVELEVTEGHTVQGRVVDAQTRLPIEGAEVGQGWTFGKSVRTDANGEYRLPGFVTRGVYEVFARARGYGEVGLDLPEVGDEPVTVDFALAPAVKARGRLVTGDGEPIVGAYVSSVSTRGCWRSARTDSQGLFRLEDLQPDVAHCLFAVADGFGTSAYEFPGPLLLSGEYDFGDIVLVPGALLSGRLVDPLGNPLSGERIRLEIAYQKRFAFSGPREEVVGESYVGSRAVDTDEQGRFSFGGLAPGSYSVGVGPSGTTDVRSLRLHAGERIRDIELVLDAALVFTGQVVDQAGDPVPRAGVIIEPEPPTDGRIAHQLTDADGRFHAEGFAAGTYRIQAFSTGLAEPEDTRALGTLSMDGIEPSRGELRLVLPFE